MRYVIRVTSIRPIWPRAPKRLKDEMVNFCVGAKPSSTSQRDVAVPIPMMRLFEHSAPMAP